MRTQKPRRKEKWGREGKRGERGERAQAAEQADERWQVLAEAVQADEAILDSTLMLEPLGSDTWRCDVVSVGWRKPRSLKEKIVLMEKFDALLTRLLASRRLRQQGIMCPAAQAEAVSSGSLGSLW